MVAEMVAAYCSCYVSESRNKTGAAIRLLYKERRIQIFNSDINIFRVSKDSESP